MEISRYLALAIEASLKAGSVIMEVYDKAFDIEIKDDNSPLTEADLRANEVINSYLKETPLPIISEENKQIDFTERKLWNSCWIVDPVDGTKEFIKRNGEFTVNIAMVENGQPVLGVIYVPASKTLYFTEVSEHKAYRAKLLKHDVTLETVKQTCEELKPKKRTNHLEVVGSRSHMTKETIHFIQELQNEGKEVSIVSKGSSLKFCLIAEGKADIYPRFAPTMEWDTAAGQAICNAVGIKVISKETDKSLLYNKENLLNPWFIASN